MELDSDDNSVKKIELTENLDIYFSPLYDWNKNECFLMAENGEIIKKIDCNSGRMIDVSEDRDNCQLFIDYNKIIGLDIYRYYPPFCSVLLDSHAGVRLLNYRTDVYNKINIGLDNENDEELPSDLVYYGIGAIDDTLIRISERRVQVLNENSKPIFIYPHNRNYRFYSGRIKVKNDKKMLFLISLDNSGEGVSVIKKYII